MNHLVRGERPALTRWEQGLRGFGLFLAVVSLAFAAGYVHRGVLGQAEYPFAVNSVAKDVLLAGVSMLLVWDVRRWSPVAVPFIVGIHLVMPALLLLTQLGDVEGIGYTAGEDLLSADNLRWAWLGADHVIVASALVLHWKATRSRYDMRYLTPAGFRALMALAEVLVLSKDRTVAPAEVAVRVDHYLASFRAKEKYRIRLAFLVLAFLPLATFHPPFHLMWVTRRQRWIERRFLDDTRDWLLPRWARDLRRALIRTAQQFCFFGYYGDEQAAARAGYIPFSRREGADTEPRPPADELKCMTPSDVSGESITADVVIVGTGAGGAMLAYELAARGREVLMLERGRHVRPSSFTENEAVQLSNLYADGALTLSMDFRFQVAQGMCVGGSTVVNNAVCFDIPEHVLEAWVKKDGLDTGLDATRLREAFASVRQFLNVRPIGPAAKRNPGGQRIADAINRLGHAGRFGTMEVVDCNIAGCRGCGYCNIGCKFGAKLSALDYTLPKAQEHYPGAVRILPECHVDKVVSARGRPRVHARLGDGRRLTVRAETVVLSAGAIASSVILQRSGLGDSLAGRSLAFNMASPVTVEFPCKVHSERGIQISHYFKPHRADDLDMTVETWFNPIVAQSLFMPGWFDEHWDNMRRYAYMTCLGAVVGTASNGSVKATRRGAGVKLDYRPTNEDFVRLKNGVKLACEIGLEAGAVRVTPATLRTLTISSPERLSLVDTEIGDTNDLSVNSAHPQGGNPISRDPRKGVVGPDFHVYGAGNVFVCDASVFPSSITVNPQLTVMALAAYAADEIAGARPCQLPGSISQAAASGPGR